MFSMRRYFWILLALSNVFASVVTVGQDRIIDFKSELMPMLTRAGCNAGECHGSAAGRGGFQLSLYGSNPDLDHIEMTLEFKGRRINRDDPAASLLVKKPTGFVDHGGGVVLDEESPAAAMLVSWIQQGALRSSHRQLKQFEVRFSTASAQITKGTSVGLRAWAQYEDTTEVDVTELVSWKIQDQDALKLDDRTHTLTALRSGQHVFIARFMNRVQPVMVLVPFPADPSQHPQTPTTGSIDQQILNKLAELNLVARPHASAATLVRRIYLDLTGKLPPVSVATEFIASNDPEKTTALINRLLDSEEFYDYWTFHLARMLQIRPQAKSDAEARAYFRWIRQQLVQGKPYNQTVRQLILSKGTAAEQPATGFYRTVRGAREQAELTSELFMGVRLRCANCHNHPLDRWTQDDYHGLSAIFARVRQGPRVEVVSQGEVTHPATGEAARPRIPGDQFLDNPDSPINRDMRIPFADWLTASDNPYFARNAVNRIWEYLMGRGLVEPVSNMSETNPATHPVLLNWLADDFVAHDFNLQHTIRQIMSSDSYQRQSSTQIPASQRAFYSGYLSRPLSPEVLLDAISDTTNVATEFKGFELSTRAIQIPYQDLPSTALDAVGRCVLDQCGSAASPDITIAQRLQWINGKLINNKLVQANTIIQQITAQSDSPNRVIQQLYLRAYSRMPTNEETDYWSAQFSADDTEQQRRELFRDILWSLMASHEFGSQH
ncbi:MAG: DUF1549 domain-containing protein [Planctomycetota bacterium]|nr:DUF1549 domain-containing protein [Planctomycetota bacterium]